MLCIVQLMRIWMHHRKQFFTVHRQDTGIKLRETDVYCPHFDDGRKRIFTPTGPFALEFSPYIAASCATSLECSCLTVFLICHSCVLYSHDIASFTTKKPIPGAIFGTFFTLWSPRLIRSYYRWFLISMSFRSKESTGLPGALIRKNSVGFGVIIFSLVIDGVEEVRTADQLDTHLWTQTASYSQCVLVCAQTTVASIRRTTSWIAAFKWWSPKCFPVRVSNAANFDTEFREANKS